MTLHLVGLVGNNAPKSYNRDLLKYLQTHFADQVQLDIAEISDIPLFNEANLETVPASVTKLADQLTAADGIIIATAEYDHAIPAALKSAIEWLSTVAHPFTTKPVMIVGASLGVQGTARAQDNLRQILNSPGVNAFVMPGYEFLLSNAPQQFDENGQLTNEKTIGFLNECFDHYQKFVADNLEDLKLVRQA
ncbi:flavin reductase [Lactiplantibacillus fabifermentans T30PCM01]|uniref:Flavin reductase n=1 Tax=Lactiplantibacillus fabifermentans T30PCM01 TaxID=1400520 RepID=W6TAJ0_9LACO|nr:NADPH-dependent FMN reductase [Lactiplantibacillus fabifermentans]ETY74948.1 flavin reductase [Lactiplantibacillus fabifermentans T30PCM01]